MSQKKLQEKSNFSDLDVDGDGVVSDHELSVVEALDNHRKYKVQERITICTCIAMLAFTVTMFFLPDTKIQALSGVSNLFYVAGGGIVAAFFGFTSMGFKRP